MTYIQALAQELASENARDPFDLPEEDECDDVEHQQDLLDWTAEQEAGWMQQDKIDLFRAEY